MEELKYVDADGNNVNISVIGFFEIPDLEKEYAIYSIDTQDKNNENGYIMLGEVIKDKENKKVVGILENEKELVMAYYNEVIMQTGGEINE